MRSKHLNGETLVDMKLWSTTQQSEDTSEQLDTDQRLLQQLEQLAQRVPEVELLRQSYLRSRKIQTALFTIAELASSDQKLTVIYKKFHEIVAQLINADNFYIALCSDSGHDIRIVYDVDHFDPVNALDIPPQRILAGMTGYLLRQRQPVLADAQRIQELIAAGEILPVGKLSRNWLGVPLYEEETCIGALVVQSYTHHVNYTEHDKQLLEFVGRHIAIALSRARFLRQLESRVKERTRELLATNQRLEQEIEQRKASEKLQAALFHIAELAQRSANLNDFYQQVHSIIGELMFAKNFYIALLKDDQSTLYFPYRVDEFDAIPEPRIHAKGLTEYLLNQDTGLPLMLNREQIDNMVADHTIDPNGTPCCSWLGAPLVDREGQIFGAIVVQSYSKNNTYTNREQELIAFVARHLADTLMHKRHNEELEKRIHERTKALSDSKHKLESEVLERLRIEKQLKYDAVHDELTGLPNRKLLWSQLHVTYDKAKSSEEEFLFAVIFIDLDRFKVINDSLGHLRGDELLKKAAVRLKRSIREQDLVARIGGDEFAVLMRRVSSPMDALLAAKRINHAFEQPFYVDGERVFSGTSIGIAVYNERYQQAQDILRDADVAMYRAKSEGRRRYVLFDEIMYQQTIHTLKLESELRVAIEHRQFEPYYQPIIDINTGKIISLEALARWRHPEKGFIQPDDFVPQAEDSGLIAEIDWQVMNRACHQLAEWRAQYPQFSELGMAVNLSGHQFAQPRLPDQIAALLEVTNIPARSLRLEVTERILLDERSDVLNVLQKLKKAGVQLLMDDFGTGYSSLSYLHRFPIDILKVDRSFITNMVNQSEHRAIVRTVLALAEGLDMGVIAEGVEDQETLESLSSMGCNFMQGYYIGRPATAQETLRRLLTNQEMLINGQ